MSAKSVRRILLVAVVGAFCAACQTTPKSEMFMSTKPPVELRAMQTRAFETTDRPKMVRTLIATLQDLGYNLDKVDAGSGTVSATKLAVLRLTAAVYPRGQSQLMVRANAMVTVAATQQHQVDDPAFYQQLFFEPLSKAIFLEALQVDDADASSTDAKRVAAPTDTKK
jgi:hypothetical protein